MYNLFTQINNGYLSNHQSIAVILKKKYLFILLKLKKYNLIRNFQIIDKFRIKIDLKYYNNKPLFKIILSSTNSNKKYFKLPRLEKQIKNYNFNLYFYTTNFGFLLFDELIYWHLGGNLVCKFEFLNKNSMLK